MIIDVNGRTTGRRVWLVESSLKNLKTRQVQLFLQDFGGLEGDGADDELNMGE